MSKKQKKVLWPTLAILSIGVCAVVIARTRGATATNKTDSSSMASVSPPKSTASPSAVVVGPTQMVSFTVYDDGIRPAVARASPGLVSIYLDDKSTHTASLILANDHPLGSINRGQGRSRGHSTILLTTGRYTIYEANRKANAATLVVAP